MTLQEYSAVKQAELDTLKRIEIAEHELKRKSQKTQNLELQLSIQIRKQRRAGQIAMDRAGAAQDMQMSLEMLDN